jgi:hypothetical protein
MRGGKSGGRTEELHGDRGEGYSAALLDRIVFIIGGVEQPRHAIGKRHRLPYSLEFNLTGMQSLFGR